MEQQSTEYTATIDYHGTPITVVYRPFAPEVEAFRRTPAHERTIDMVDPLLEKVLVSWDIEDEEGNAIPASRDGFRLLPIDFKPLLLRQLTEDLENHHKSEPSPKLSALREQIGRRLNRIKSKKQPSRRKK
jgi:hypothetical protein